MNRALLEAVITESEQYRRPLGDPELDAVETAILIEDALGVVLTDEEVSALTGDPGSLRRCLTRRASPA